MQLGPDVADESIRPVAAQQLLDGSHQARGDSFLGVIKAGDRDRVLVEVAVAEYRDEVPAAGAAAEVGVRPSRREDRTGRLRCQGFG